MILNVVWELYENAAAGIQGYRDASDIQKGYIGDSFLNIAADITFVALGWFVARDLVWLGRWPMAFLLGGLGELFFGLYMRDSCLLTFYVLVSGQLNLAIPVWFLDWQKYLADHIVGLYQEECASKCPVDGQAECETTCRAP